MVVVGEAKAKSRSWIVTAYVTSKIAEGDEVIARLNPKTGEIENLEMLFFSTRLLRSDLFELPVTADLRLAGKSE